MKLQRARCATVGNSQLIRQRVAPRAQQGSTCKTPLQETKAKPALLAQPANTAALGAPAVVTAHQESTWPMQKLPMFQLRAQVAILESTALIVAPAAPRALRASGF